MLFSFFVFFVFVTAFIVKTLHSDGDLDDRKRLLIFCNNIFTHKDIYMYNAKNWKNYYKPERFRLFVIIIFTYIFTTFSLAYNNTCLCLRENFFIFLFGNYMHAFQYNNNTCINIYRGYYYMSRVTKQRGTCK